MSYFFSDHFRAALAANQGVMDGHKIKVVLFRYAPAMGSYNPSWTGARTVAELTAQPGWTQVTGISGYPFTRQLDVGTRTIGGSRYVMFSDYSFNELTEVAEVRAVGVVYVGALNSVTDPLIFVSNTPIGEITNVAPDDALTSSPDSTFPDATNRWLFGWGTTTPEPIEGPLVLSRGSPDFEVSGSQHAWLYPQRANMIANPSFEAPGTNFWSGNSALTRSSISAEPAFLKPSVGTVSTPDPGVPPAQCTFVYKIRGPLTTEPAVYAPICSQWVTNGQASWLFDRHNVAGPNGVRYVVTADGTHAAAVSRFGHTAVPTKGWEYLAASIDRSGFTITGHTSPDGATWTALAPLGSGAAITPFDTNLPLIVGGSGFVPFDGEIEWIELRTGLDPKAGTVIWRFDANEYPGTGTSYIDPRGRTWTLSNANAITPSTSPSWAGGIAAAPVTGYLTPTVGTVSTPDPGPLPAECVFVYKVRATMSPGQPVAVQWGGDSNNSWAVQTSPSEPSMYWLSSTNGTTMDVQQFLSDFSTNDEWYALSVGSNLIGQRSTDGVTWTQTGTIPNTHRTLFDSSAGVQVGGHSAVGVWTGRIYSVECRSGLDPKAGTVLWRFDANDYPGTGTSYVDPRGRTWTLSAAGAITAKTGAIPGYAVMESNIFPTRLGELNSEQWTVQLLARGNGRLKVGFVWWDADYRLTACDWGEPDETYTLNPSTWIHIATHRHAPEAHIAMVRLELQGSDLAIDRVLAERGYLKDWLYFDGDERYGARDDFSWYGGSNRQGASYSLWYNHRKAVTGRLFARTVDPNDPEANITDEDMEEQGLVYRWVPAGITVVPHLDVFYPFDVQNPLPPKSAGVLARYGPSTPDGVSNPW